MRRIASFVALVALISGAIVADGFVPPHRRASRALGVSVPGGLLSCPLATTSKGGVVYVANLGTGSSATRVSWLPDTGAPVRADAIIAAGSARAFAAPRAFTRRRVTATVEYAGADVVASHAVFTAEGEGAEACASPGASTVIVQGLRTKRATSTLVIANPGGADADVTTTLIANGRSLSPINLSKRVISAHARLDVDLAEFAFGVDRITAIVHASSGRIAAEGLIRSNSGALLIAGQQPSSSLVLVSPRRVPFGDDVVAIGAEDAAIEGRVITASSQGHAAGIPPVLTAGKNTGLVLAAAPSALALDVIAGSPLAAYGHWIDGSSAAHDDGGIPALTPARRWGAVIGASRSQTTRLVAIVVNPSNDTAVGRVRILAGGKFVSSGLALEAGRLQVFSPKLDGIAAIDLDASVPVVLMMAAITVENGIRRSFAVAGTPLLDIAPAVVAIDPRVGVGVSAPDRLG